MKTPMSAIALGALAVGMTVPASGPATAQDSLSISLATGGTAGTYFPLGGAMAQAWTDQIEGLTVTAESTGASVVNMRLIDGGEAELALVQNDIASYAHAAEEMFADDDPVQSALGMAVLYPEVIQIVTLEGTGIETVDDLSGQGVAVGAPGSGTEANARQIMEAHGITYDDISEQFLSFGEAVDALRDGRIQAAFLTAGIPTAALVDLDASDDVRLVEISEGSAAEIAETWPFYTAFTVPGGTYSGIEEDSATVAVSAMIVASADLDADVVENMLNVLYDEGTLEMLCDTHVRGCDVTLDTAQDGMPIDLHPGAEAFYSGQ